MSNDTVGVIRDLTTERLDLLAAKEKIDRQIADIDEALMRHLPAIGGRYELPGLPGQGVKLSPGKRSFSKERAAEILTPTQYAAACVSVPTSAQARKTLGDTLVDQCCVTGKPFISTMRPYGDRR